MLLENVKKLNEAKYAKGKPTYFVQAFDPEDGVIQVAGPFNDDTSAKKFAKFMYEQNKKFHGRVQEDDLPSYHVAELMDPEDFTEVMMQHIEVFAN